MSRIFLSHSSRNNELAIHLRDWLAQNGWDDVFLDLDPQKGLAPGENWQEALKVAVHRCEAAVVLISPEWLASSWCRAELQTAKLLGKRIIPLLISELERSSLPVEITADNQLADLVRDPLGYERLKEGLRRAGLDSTSFPFPAGRRPYPGLEPLTEEDAAIFFGREAHVVRALAQLRAMRNAGVERAFVILGASGAGKSSFLRAGLVPRLRRDDRNNVVLPVIRPERGVLSGKYGLAASLEGMLLQDRFAGSDIPRTRAKIRDFLSSRRDGLGQILNAIRTAATTSVGGDAAPAPTLVLAIDQAEELFNEDGKAELEPFLNLLSCAFDRAQGLLAVFALPSDAYPRFQEEPRLAELAQHPFSLPPMLEGSYRVIMEGPARLAVPPLAIEPALVDALLADAKGPDALPLLAFTLERLYQDYGAGGVLSLSSYRELGGIGGAIDCVIDEVRLKARDIRELPMDPTALNVLLRRTFLPHLVRVTAADEFARRVAPVDELPAAARGLVDLLVAHRLLIRDRRPTPDGSGEVDVVEVAHEALLREWRMLAGWLDEEKSALRAIEVVGRAARDWSARERSMEWLLHKGGRLQEARDLAARPEFSVRIGVTGLAYLAACQEAETQAQQSNERARRVRRRVVWTSAWVGLLLLLGSAGELRLAQKSMDSDARTFSMLAAQALKEEKFESAMRYALAALPPTGSIRPIPHDEPEAILAEAASRSRLTGVLGNNDSVWCVAVSPDGARIAAGMRDKTVAIWDARNRKLLLTLTGHTDSVRYIAFSPDGRHLITSSDDKTARVWDTATYETVAILKGHEGAVTAGRYSPTGRIIATGGEDAIVRLWDAETYKEIVALEGHTDLIWDLAFDPHGQRLATASADKTVRLWEVDGARSLRTITGHHGGAMVVTFSPGGHRLASAARDGAIMIWDPTSAELVGKLEGHADLVRGLAFTGDGKRLLSASYDGTVRLWDLDTRAQLATIAGDERSYEGIALDPDGRIAIAAGADGGVRLLDLSDRPELPTLTRVGQRIWRLAIDPTASRIATVLAGDETVIWDLRTGKRIAELIGPYAGRDVGFSPDGRFILTAGENGAALWAEDPLRIVHELKGHAGTVISAAFNADGTLAATASTEGSIRVWNAVSGTLRVERQQPKMAFPSVAFDATSTRIVTATGDGTAVIWNATTLAEFVTLKGHTDVVYSAAFSPDGKSVVTASADKTARVWNVATGTVSKVLSGHHGRIYSATFSPDGRLVATASDDRTVRIWSVETGKVKRVIVGHEQRVTDAVFTSDGSRLLTSAEDGTFRQWAIGEVSLLSGAELRNRVCESILSAPAAQMFSVDQMKQPVLEGLTDDMQNPCERTKPFK